VKEAVEAGARRVKACEFLGVSLRTIERWGHIPEDQRRGPHTRPANALTEQEREKILGIANSETYANLSPSQIVPLLADKGEYIASESTFYRILKEESLLAHRSHSRLRRPCPPEALKATKPNEIWSWDITYLKAAIKGTFYYLYLPMDIFSRKIIFWMVFENESSENASLMIENACKENKIAKDQIILHSDNGGPMKGATMLATLQRLGVAPSFSRPKVSNDNPYSEALFKTLKYCPGFPERGFKSLDEAEEWVKKFVHWYNNIHLHSGIKFVTPASRHIGDDKKILEQRNKVYQKAKTNNPNRWSGATRNWTQINQVHLNPTKDKTNDARQTAA
jgi:transposase InsO family protein